MAKKKHYYILVFTDNGPKYVTDILPNKYAEWCDTEKPLEFSTYDSARSICTGLNLNFNLSQVVTSEWVIESQPYNYADFKCQFVEREQEEE